MNEAKHTPGPWVSDERYDCKNSHSVKSGYKNLAIVNYFNIMSNEEAKANAKLMAAAPDLLEIVKAYAAMWEEGEENLSRTLYKKAKDAIEKAEGRGYE